MAGQQTTFRRAKTIAGAALVGLGTFFQYQNLVEEVARFREVLDADGSETLGVLPAVIQVVSQIWQAYIVDHQRFLGDFLQQVLVSSWPLLLVIVGTVLSRNSSTDTDTVDGFPKKMADLSN
jgi:uncharacterized membrane protein